MPYKDIEKRREFARRRYAERRAGSPPKPPTKQGEDIACDYCGKMFYRKPAEIMTTNFCSRECNGKWQSQHNRGEAHPNWKAKITQPCENCGTPITRAPWAMKRRRIGVFCDKKCFGEWKSKNWTGEDNPSWAGGYEPYYGDNWRRQSREARHRDNHRCQLCDKAEEQLYRALDVHHIIPFRMFNGNYRKANYLANLIALCHSCHMEAEALSRNGEYKDWPSLKTAILLRRLQNQTELVDSSRFPLAEGT